MNRLVFANQLRGLAALSVVASHLVGVFWSLRDFIALATFSPAQTGDPPGLFVLFSNPWFNFGPFGVGVFFLISGLVIPISLERHGRGSFLLARLLRIYPTYVAALLLEVGVLHLASAYWHRPFFYSPRVILSNALLFYNEVGLPSIDLVNWTLCIELKFYLLMALLAPQIRACRSWPLFAVAGLLLLGNLALAGGLLRAPVAAHPEEARSLSIASLYLVFMLVGVLFNYRMRGRLSGPAFLAAAGLMLALFLASWKASAIRDQFPTVTVNYLYALALFGILFALRRHARESRVLDFVAAISFPLYLVHALIGFSLLKLLMLSGHMAYLPALAVTLPVVLLVATLLHVTVEVRSIAMGRLLARRSGTEDPAAVTLAAALGPR